MTPIAAPCAGSAYLHLLAEQAALERMNAETPEEDAIELEPTSSNLPIAGGWQWYILAEMHGHAWIHRSAALLLGLGTLLACSRKVSMLSRQHKADAGATRSEAPVAAADAEVHTASEPHLPRRRRVWQYPGTSAARRQKLDDRKARG